MIQEKFKTWLQKYLPQHGLSRLAGWIAERKWPWWKNYLIRDFIRRYQVDLRIAQYESIDEYPDFNSFFTRRLKPELRPIVQEPYQIASPVDGEISQMGTIQNDAIIQAKGMYYPLLGLLGGIPEHAKTFEGGQFATIYLAPKDYHRVHMPLTGILRETIYVPGELFSVNQETTRQIPGLFTRNERLICLFDTSAGRMGIILVGAMLVSGIKTAWPCRLPTKSLSQCRYDDQAIELHRGTELGYFTMGSTVIILFPGEMMEWNSLLKAGSTVKMGQLLGTCFR